MASRKILDNLSVESPSGPTNTEISMQSDEMDDLSHESTFRPGFVIDSVTKMGVTHIFPSFEKRHVIGDVSVPHFDYSRTSNVINPPTKYDGTDASHVYPRTNIMPPAFVEELNKPLRVSQEEYPLPTFLQLTKFYRMNTLSDPAQVAEEHNSLVSAMKTYNSPVVASVRSVSANSSSHVLNKCIRNFMAEKIKKCKNVLIIGAGKGADYSRLCSFHSIDKESRIVMIEPNEQLATICKNTCHAARGKVIVHRMTLKVFLDTNVDKFDTIISNNSLHYALGEGDVENARGIYDRLLDRLSEDGKFIGSLPSYEAMCQKPLGFVNDCGILETKAGGPWGTMRTEMCGVFRDEPILPLVELQRPEYYAEMSSPSTYKDFNVLDSSMMSCFSLFCVTKKRADICVTNLRYGMLNRGFYIPPVEGEVLPALPLTIIDPSNADLLPKPMKGSHLTWNDAFNFVFCDHWLMTEKLDGVPGILFAYDDVWCLYFKGSFYSTLKAAVNQNLYQVEVVQYGSGWKVYHVHTFRSSETRIGSYLSSLLSEKPSFMYSRPYYPMEIILGKDVRKVYKEGFVLIDPYINPRHQRYDKSCYYLKFLPTIDLKFQDGVFESGLDGQIIRKRDDKEESNSPGQLLSMISTLPYAGFVSLILTRAMSLSSVIMEHPEFGSFPMQSVFSFPMSVPDSLSRNAYISKVKAGLFLGFEDVVIDDDALQFVAHGWSKELWELIFPIINKHINAFVLKVK